MLSPHHSRSEEPLRRAAGGLRGGVESKRLFGFVWPINPSKIFELTTLTSLSPSKTSNVPTRPWTSVRLSSVFSVPLAHQLLDA